MIINYKDGRQEKIISDKSWKTSFGRIQFNSIYTAEHVDNNKENKSWKQVIEVPNPTDKISSQQLPPVRKVKAYPAVSFVKLSDNTYLYDFGQNMSGVTELKIDGPKGTIVRVKHGEQLKDGRLDNSGIEVHYRPKDDKDPFQTDIYTLNGNGQEIFSPIFNYKGFRYAEVKINNNVDLNINNLTAYFTHTDVEPLGTIQTSNDLINQIWDATNKAYLSNLFGYPTDCPQREKNGWTGDAHTVIETALYNFDGILVYEKWMDDHRDEQQIDGTLPSIIPTAGWGYTWGNGPDWTSSMILVPWNIYKFYGDKRILEENYENMRRYVYKIKSVSKDNLTNWGLGDWVPVKSKSNLEFTSSIFYFSDVLIVSKIAKILGHNEDASELKNLAKDIKSSINNKFFDKETNTYASGTQTEMSMALFRGIVSAENKQLVADNLAKSVVDNNSKLDVGLLGSKTILNALSQNGYADLAFKLASSNEYPSWGYWIENGATTLYENWNLSAESDLSLNHIMFGEISAWFYKALGGINVDVTNPGFKNILLKPHFVNGLSDFTATFKSPYGKVSSSWERVGDMVIYKVYVPPNTQADLFFDNSVKEVKYENLLVNLSNPYVLQPGYYEFEVY
jgi:alpha-L-rhamnosidase